MEIANLKKMKITELNKIAKELRLQSWNFHKNGK